MEGIDTRPYAPPGGARRMMMTTIIYQLEKRIRVVHYQEGYPPPGMGEGEGRGGAQGKASKTYPERIGPGVIRD